MRKYFFLGIGAVSCLILLLANPTKQEHSDAVKELFNRSLTEKLSENAKKSNDGMESFGAGLGMLLGKAMIDKMVDSYITRDNYLLFSLTKMNIEDEERTIGIGALGNVHIFNKVKDKASEIFEKDKN